MGDYVAADKTYAESYGVFRRGLIQQQEEWMSKKIIPAIKAKLEKQSIQQLNILAFGSGFGEVDTLFLRELKAQYSLADSIQINYTVVERNEEFVRLFQERVKENVELLKNVNFTWVSKTCEDFFKCGNFVANSYHIVHFVHVLYYVDIRTVLSECMSKLLKSDGCLFMVVQTEVSLYATNFYKYKGKINDAWTHFEIVTNKQLSDIATENKWNYLSVNGDRKFDITDVFKPRSQEGRMLIDFFYHAKNLVDKLDEAQLNDILTYFKENSYEENKGGDLRVFAKADEGLVLYFKE